MFWKIYRALKGPVAWKAFERLIGVDALIDKFLDDQEKARLSQ